MCKDPQSCISYVSPNQQVPDYWTNCQLITIPAPIKLQITHNFSYKINCDHYIYFFRICPDSSDPQRERSARGPPRTLPIRLADGRTFLPLRGNIHSRYNLTLSGNIHSRYNLTLRGNLHSRYNLTLRGNLHSRYNLTLRGGIHSR